MIRVVTKRNRAANTRLLIEMHRQRRAVFVDRLGWRLTVSGGLEIDAYDGPAALYLLSMMQERLLSSARLLPTTQPHLMSARFAHLCPGGVPRGPGVWEASRFCVDPALCDRATRRAQLGRIIAGILELGLARGLERVTFVAGSALLPLALSAGWAARPLGPAHRHGGDWIQAVAARVSQDGLDAVRARHGLDGPVIGPCHPMAEA